MKQQFNIPNVKSDEFNPNSQAHQQRLLEQHLNRTLDETLNKQQLQKRTTRQEYYFLKQGVYMSSKYNKYVVKCRKERHFFDFGKKNKEDEEMSYS